tara:strand:+ start:1355 stop:1540 length:186 start_codon:yes stop_codon:yes gene_type:complete
MPNNNLSWPLQSEALSQNEVYDEIKKVEFLKSKYIISYDDNADNERGSDGDKVFVLGQSDF